MFAFLNAAYPKNKSILCKTILERKLNDVEGETYPVASNTKVPSHDFRILNLKLRFIKTCKKLYKEIMNISIAAPLFNFVIIFILKL